MPRGECTCWIGKAIDFIQAHAEAHEGMTFNLAQRFAGGKAVRVIGRVIEFASVGNEVVYRAFYSTNFPEPTRYEDRFRLDPGDELRISIEAER